MHNSVSPRLHRKLVVKFCLALGIIVIIVNTLVTNFVLHFPSQHYSITVAALNTTAGLATIYGFVTIYRYGFRGKNGRSLLYLTIGILFWLLADLSLAYGHFVQHHEEEQSLVVSLADLYWIIGYVFFSLHLFTAIRLVRRDQVHKFSVAMVVIASGSIIVYNLILPSGFYASQEGRIIGETKTGFMDLILSILYPILDLVLIIPSVI